MRHQHKNSEFSLDSQQVQKLIEAAPTLRDRVLIQLLAYTGIRRAEACTVRLADLDFTRQRLLIRHGKGGKQRFVFIPSDMVQSLSAFTDDRSEGYLFPGRNGRQMSLRNINHIVKKVGRLAGVDNPNPRHDHVTPHLLRHSFARNWKRAGGSMESLQKILGHASLRTTLDVYGTESLDETQANYHLLEHRLVST